MLLKFKIKKALLSVDNIERKIGSDGLFYYEIDDVTGITLGSDIDA